MFITFRSYLFITLVIQFNFIKFKKKRAKVRVFRRCSNQLIIILTVTTNENQRIDVIIIYYYY